MPEIGEQVFYQNGPNSYPQKGYLIGASSRSWFMHHTPDAWWVNDPALVRKHGLRYDKKELMFVSEETYKLGVWAHEHREKIRYTLLHATPEQLKKVAEVIGYTE